MMVCPQPPASKGPSSSIVPYAALPKFGNLAVLFALTRCPVMDFPYVAAFPRCWRGLTFGLTQICSGTDDPESFVLMTYASVVAS